MEEVIKYLVETLGLQEKQINAVLAMLSEGATIPFIARYRKDATGNLDEDQIRAIEEQYKYQENLLTRKQDVIRLIDEKGMLTPEIEQSILKCVKLAEVEDIYRPYKEKKKTKASEAIKNGLEPLAKMIMSFPTTGSLEEMAKKFVNEAVPTTDTALEGAGYIIAEWISDNASYRKYIRSYFYKNGIISYKNNNLYGIVSVDEDVDIEPNYEDIVLIISNESAPLSDNSFFQYAARPSFTAIIYFSIVVDFRIAFLFRLGISGSR